MGVTTTDVSAADQCGSQSGGRSDEFPLVLVLTPRTQTKANHHLQ